MNRFDFGSSSGGDSEEENEDNLPYPEALLRSDFLSPDFNALTYLSSLSDRHQTLEDLQSDLRERSQFLSEELLDLVNANYEQFLNLGSNLKGGEERLEDIRLGLLGFKSSILDIRAKVDAKKNEVERLLGEKSNITRQITFGRKLLEIDARLEELEINLTSKSSSQTFNESTECDNQDDIHEKIRKNENLIEGGIYVINLKILHRLSMDFRSIEGLMAEIGTDHPYVMAQQVRMVRSKTNILIKLGKELVQTKMTSDEDKIKLLKLLTIYRELGAGDEAVRVIRKLKSKGQ